MSPAIQHFLPLLPELVVAVAGVALLLRHRWPPDLRRWVPGIAFLLVLFALGLELWLGGTLVTFARGAYTQDRFSLFGKTALLVALLLVIAVSGWEGERGERGLAPAALTVLAGMVATSATSLPLLWVAVVVAAGGGLLAGSTRIAGQRPLLWTAVGGAAASAVGMLAVGLIGHSLTLTGLREGIPGPSGPGLALASIVAVSGVLAPLAMLPLRAIGGEEEPAVQEAVLGALVGGAAVLAAAKLAAALFGAGTEWGPYAAVVATAAVLICALAALATRSIRALAAWLVTAQLAWCVAALATHDRLGSAAAVYLLGAVVLAAAPVPLLAYGLADRAALSGAGGRQPWRWLALSLGLLSLAGIPPLAGFFGEFTVALELLHVQLAWVLAAALLGAGISLWAVLRVLIAVWLEPLEHEERRGAAWGLPITAALAVLLLLVYGVAAQPVHALAVQSAEAIGLLR